MGRVLPNWLLGQLLRSTVIAVILAAPFHLLGVPAPRCSAFGPVPQASSPTSDF